MKNILYSVKQYTLLERSPLKYQDLEEGQNVVETPTLIGRKNKTILLTSMSKNDNNILVRLGAIQWHKGGRGLAKMSRDIFSKILSYIHIFGTAFLKEKGYFLEYQYVTLHRGGGGGVRSIVTKWHIGGGGG